MNVFGYIQLSDENITEEAKTRYHAYYCGLCNRMQERYGVAGCMVLSYDMTFLYILLSSLYEPFEMECSYRCVPHPLKPHLAVCNEIADYCCDMNILLAYHKAIDDMQDKEIIKGTVERCLLRKAYLKVKSLYPEKEKTIEEILNQFSALEKAKCYDSDKGANLTAQLMREVYEYRNDEWTDTVTKIGMGMGRFIYIMDAYDDLAADIKYNRYNPLILMKSENYFDEQVKEILMLLISEAANAFEGLPLVKDIDILRNIIYSGCWIRYYYVLQHKRKNEKNRFEGENE